MTPYEIWKGKKPNLRYVHEFGSTCSVLNDREHGRKFDAKSDKRIFQGYTLNSQPYRVYNKRTQTIMQSVNVIVDDRESDSPKIRREDVEAKLTHRRKNDSITSDLGTYSRGINSVTKSDSSSDASTQEQATHGAIPRTDTLVRNVTPQIIP